MRRLKWDHHMTRLALPIKRVQKSIILNSSARGFPRIATILIALSCITATGARGNSSKTIEDVKLTPASLAPQCTPIEGEHPISLQAATHYGMVERYSLTLFKPPVRKAYQSFDCSGAKSTIYYYEYASKEDLDGALGFTKGLIWGEGGRSSMHPELIMPVENVLVIISSRDAEFFANDFFYGIPGTAGKAFKEAMEPYGEKNYAEAEKRFRALTRNESNLLLGHLYLAHSLFFREKYHEAIPEYERARELGAKNGGLTQLNERILSDQLGMS